MIKAIIFDFFGVIVTEGLTSFKDAFFADKPELREKAHKLTDDFNSGLMGMSYDDYLVGLAELAGTNWEVTAKYLDSEQPNKLLLEYIAKELKPKYKIGILSNAGNDWIDELIGSDNAKLFDEIILSHKINLIKPDPEFYLLITKKLNVDPRECIYVDDKQKYCDGAEAVGMKAIKYEDFVNLKQNLNKILVSN
jgi:epoxide hydrolase-like predicted phosphatase